MAIVNVGIDLAKNVFALHGVNEIGQTDLRRPSVAGCLGLDRPWSPGLSEAILEPEYELATVVRTLDAFNLSVLPAGAAQPTPYELLNSPRLEALLREARRQYDCVLIDTPPAVPLMRTV